MAIKAIIFDCFGVLIKSGHNLLRQDFPELKSFVDELQAKSDLGVLTRQEFNQSISDRTSLSAVEIDERYWGTNKYDYQVVELAENLKSTGDYRIGLLSNISRDWMPDILLFFDEKKLFDEILLSGDVNVVKPNPQIFEMMASKLNLAPEECVMIDDVASNVNGARTAGMHGIVFFSASQTKEDLNSLLLLNHA
jgi:HAD superfamily hydrolase (TIGR01509 family)